MKITRQALLVTGSAAAVLAVGGTVVALALTPGGTGTPTPQRSLAAHTSHVQAADSTSDAVTTAAPASTTAAAPTITQVQPPSTPPVTNATESVSPTPTTFEQSNGNMVTVTPQPPNSATGGPPTESRSGDAPRSGVGPGMSPSTTRTP